jgi:hypothetical protein
MVDLLTGTRPVPEAELDAVDTIDMVCSEAEHERMKADDTQWAALPCIGRQRYDYGDGEAETLEMRNCACGSTLVAVVAATPSAHRAP